MTQKHLVDLATIIASETDKGVRVRLAVRIGKVCERHNNRFNWKIWDKACNVDFKEDKA